MNTPFCTQKIKLNGALKLASICFGILFSACNCQDDYPTVTTGDISELTSRSVVCLGSVKKQGSETVVEYGISWSTDESFNQEYGRAQGSGSMDAFQVKLDDLEPDITYYYRAYATSEVGTGFGAVKSFKTMKERTKCWESILSFDAGYFCEDLIVSDSMNIWAMMTAVSDANPIPDLPVKVYKSKDGGKTWTSYTFQNSNQRRSILSAIDENTAFLNIKSLGLYKTMDGGTSWSLINEDPFCKEHNLPLMFFDANEGLCSYWTDSTGLRIFKTMNGGINWSEVELPWETPRIMDEAFWVLGNAPYHRSGDRVMAATDCGKVLISEDRGDTWTILIYDNSSPYQTFTNIALLDENRFAMVSLGAWSANDSTMQFYRTYMKVISTTNGGQTWDQQTLPIFPGNISIIRAAIHYTLASITLKKRGEPTCRMKPAKRYIRRSGVH
ncbi:MAG: hypothetical protein U0T82_13530 [Bacteroidales bacterium]